MCNLGVVFSSASRTGLSREVLTEGLTSRGVATGRSNGRLVVFVADAAGVRRSGLVCLRVGVVNLLAYVLLDVTVLVVVFLA